MNESLGRNDVKQNVGKAYDILGRSNVQQGADGGESEVQSRILCEAIFGRNCRHSDGRLGFRSHRMDFNRTRNNLFIFHPTRSPHPLLQKPTALVMGGTV